jgi:Gas vesicle synthesis protein GvpO/Histone H1-like nucleoprotein HC2
MPDDETTAASEASSESTPSTTDASAKKTAAKKSTAKKAAAKKTASKTAAKKTAAKKSAAKKSGVKKSAGKKTAAPKTAARRSRSGTPGEESSGGSSGSAVTGVRLAHRAAEQLVELTQKPFEGVVGLERVDDGWTVQVEVLELRRVPETTDVIGMYEVRLDTSGQLVGYKRLHRYVRGEAGEHR